MSEKTMREEVSKLITAERRKRAGDEPYPGEHRFRMPEYDRKNRNILLAVFAVDLLLIFALSVIARLGVVLPWFWLAVLACVVLSALLVVYLVLNRRWREDYTTDRDGFIVPGRYFKYSTRAGETKDVFVDAERKLRRCLLSANPPDNVHDGTMDYYCDEIDRRQIVFCINLYDAYGAYNWLKKQLPQLSAEFGDPDGAELIKTGETSYKLKFDKLRSASDLEYGVQWEQQPSGGEVLTL